MPGVAPTIQEGSFLKPKPPSPSDCAGGVAVPAALPGGPRWLTTAPTDSSGTIALVAGGLLAAGIASYFLFLE